MADIRTINDRVAVAPQITAADVPAIRDAGFVTIVNNRPDGEEPGQPTGDAIAAAAAEQGLRYVDIPVHPGGLAMAQVDAMVDALTDADGPVLAFCRSGTRSCNLWALAAAKAGRDPALLVAQAAGAGYDLSGLQPSLEALAAR